MTNKFPSFREYWITINILGLNWKLESTTKVLYPCIILYCCIGLSGCWKNTKSTLLDKYFTLNTLCSLSLSILTTWLTSSVSWNFQMSGTSKRTLKKSFFMILLIGACIQLLKIFHIQCFIKISTFMQDSFYFPKRMQTRIECKILIHFL